MTTPEQEKELTAEERMRRSLQVLCLGKLQATAEQISAQFDAAVVEAKQEEMEQCCKDIRDACGACSGTGHASIDSECEYCGRPIRAIRARSEGES